MGTKCVICLEEQQAVNSDPDQPPEILVNTHTWGCNCVSNTSYIIAIVLLHVQVNNFKA